MYYLLVEVKSLIIRMHMSVFAYQVEDIHIQIERADLYTLLSEKSVREIRPLDEIGSLKRGNLAPVF